MLQLNLKCKHKNLVGSFIIGNYIGKINFLLKKTLMQYVYIPKFQFKNCIQIKEYVLICIEYTKSVTSYSHKSSTSRKLNNTPFFSPSKVTF